MTWHIWVLLRDWFPYILPAVSNLILVLLGIIMSLPTLADKIEKTPKHRKWLAAICLIFGLIGFIFDVSQRRGSDVTNKKLLGNVGTALANTDELVQDTRTLVTTVSVTMPKLNELDAKLAGLNTQIAKTQNDPKVLAELQRLAKQTQEQRDDLVRELQAVTSVPQIVNQLNNWELERRGAEQEIKNFEWEELTRYRETHHPSDQKGEDQILAKYEPRVDKSNADYAEKLAEIIATADSVRRELLQRIPHSQSSLDKLEEQRFTQAKTNPELLDRKDAAHYLEYLASQVPPPPK